MTTQKTPTQEEIEEAKEKVREVALKNLKAENLMNIYTNYIAQSGVYGDKGAKIMHDGIYDSMLDKDIEYTGLETGKKNTLYKGTGSVGDSLRNSREEGKVFSGNISEKKIVDSVVKIIQDSMQYLKVEDVIKYLDKDIKRLKKEYRGKYVADLIPQMPSEEEAKKMTLEEYGKLEEQMQFAKSILGAYTNKALNSRMNLAFEDSEKREWQGLESILMEEGK